MSDTTATPRFLTERDVLDAHAQFGRLDWHMVKKGMGPNWPARWEKLGPGESIFEIEETEAS
jgi:hypothetical protein